MAGASWAYEIQMADGHWVRGRERFATSKEAAAKLADWLTANAEIEGGGVSGRIVKIIA